MNEWIDIHFNYTLLDDLALDQAGRWHELGIETNKYIEEFVKLNAYHYVDIIPYKSPEDINEVDAITSVVNTTTDPEKNKEFYQEVLQREGAAEHVVIKYS